MSCVSAMSVIVRCFMLFIFVLILLGPRQGPICAKCRFELKFFLWAKFWPDFGPKMRTTAPGPPRQACAKHNPTICCTTAHPLASPLPAVSSFHSSMEAPHLHAPTSSSPGPNATKLFASMLRRFPTHDPTSLPSRVIATLPIASASAHPSVEPLLILMIPKHL